jgi:hypothetical protein
MVVNFPVTVALECPQCGAAGQGSCHCGVPYIPAGERAKKAVAENPELSDRAIAAEIDVDKNVVSRARKSTGAPAPVRTGKDGKRRKMPKKKLKAKAAPAAKEEQSVDDAPAVEEMKPTASALPITTSADDDIEAAQDKYGLAAAAILNELDGLIRDHASGHASLRIKDIDGFIEAMHVRLKRLQEVRR